MKDGVILILLPIILLFALLGRDRAGPVAVLEDVSSKLTNADWCAPVKAPPVLRTPRNRVDYRVGTPFNDKGNV